MRGPKRSKLGSGDVHSSCWSVQNKMSGHDCQTSRSGSASSKSDLGISLALCATVPGFAERNGGGAKNEQARL
jgi:hypothetical protein